MSCWGCKAPAGEGPSHRAGLQIQEGPGPLVHTVVWVGWLRQGGGIVGSGTHLAMGQGVKDHRQPCCLYGPAQNSWLLCVLISASITWLPARGGGRGYGGAQSLWEATAEEESPGPGMRTMLNQKSSSLVPCFLEGSRAPLLAGQAQGCSCSSCHQEALQSQ